MSQWRYLGKIRFGDAPQMCGYCRLRLNNCFKPRLDHAIVQFSLILSQNDDHTCCSHLWYILAFLYSQLQIGKHTRRKVYTCISMTSIRTTKDWTYGTAVPYHAPDWAKQLQLQPKTRIQVGDVTHLCVWEGGWPTMLYTYFQQVGYISTILISFVTEFCLDWLCLKACR